MGVNPTISCLSPSHSQVNGARKTSQPWFSPSFSSLVLLIFLYSLTLRAFPGGNLLDSEPSGPCSPVAAQKSLCGPWQRPCHTALAHQLTGPCPIPGGHRPSREVRGCPPIQEPNTGLGSEWVPTKQMNEEMNEWTSVPFSLQDILGWEHDYLIPQQNPILKYLRKYIGCTWVKITVLFCSL